MPEEAATRKDVASMTDREMVDELAAMFDVAEPLPNEQKEEEPAEEVEATAEQGDEDTSEETDADQDMEVEASEETDETDDDKWMPNTLDELIEALETEPDQLLDTMKIHVKTDGQEGEATLKEVIANYQKGKTLDQRLEAYANERKQFDAQASERLQKLEDRLKDADTTVNALEQLLFQDYQAVNWSELKTDDPTEYMLKQQEMRDRYSSLQEVKSKLQSDRETEQKQQQEENQQQMQELVQQQIQAAQNRVPDWKDEQRMASDIKEIQSFLLSEGLISEQEIPYAIDHRFYVIANMAMKYQQMSSTAEPKMKKLKTKPKFAKPGTRKNPAQVSQKRKQEAFDRAKKLQTDDAWADALVAKLS